MSDKTYRVSVRGLAQCEVTDISGEKTQDGGRYEGFDVEYALGDFFYGHDCKVDEVRVMIDKKKPPKKSVCRGFAFVDFEDEESMQKALALNGATEAGEVFLDPNIKKLIVERPRSQRPAEPEVTAWPASDPKKQVQLKNERARTMGLEQELRLTVNRINEVMAQIEGHYTRQKALESKSTEQALDAEKQQQQKLIDQIQEMRDKEVSLATLLRSEEDRTRALEQLLSENGIEEVAAEEPEHAFREFSGAVRETIASDISTQARGLLASITEDRDESASPRPPVPEELRRGCSISSTASQREWAKGKNRDVSQSLLRQKQESFEAARNETRRGWADISDEENDWEQSPTNTEPKELSPRHKVQISNLPQLDAKHLEKDLRNVVAHFLKVNHNEDYDIVDIELDGAGEATSFASVMAGGRRKKECKAVVSFRDAADASFLTRKICETGKLSLAGQTLTACLLSEVQANNDRLLHAVEPSDVSSKKSYQTAGTTATAQNDESFGNRTAVFEGIATDVKMYDVRDAVKKMLVRSYHSASRVFEESKHLHGGDLDKALEIRKAGNKKGENGGTAILRLKFHDHAEWLVRQKKVQLCGASVTVKWAKQSTAAPAGDGVEVMNVPPYLIGKILGRGGETIKKLQTDSRCRIVVDSSGNGDVRLIGSGANIATARQMISNILGPTDGKGYKGYNSGKGGKGKSSGTLSGECAGRVQELCLDINNEAENALASLPKMKAMGILDTIDDKLKRGEEIKNASGYVISSVKREKEKEGEGKRW